MPITIINKYKQVEMLKAHSKEGLTNNQNINISVPFGYLISRFVFINCYVLLIINQKYLTSK